LRPHVSPDETRSVRDASARLRPVPSGPLRGALIGLICLHGGSPAAAASPVESRAPAVDAAGAPADAGAPPRFASQGHVLVFRPAGYAMTNARYALAVDFVGADPALPVSDTAAAPDGDAPAPLGRVSYPDLYPGIRVDYDAPAGGIARSTWTIAPGADAGMIRMRYNRPVALDRSDGSLAVAYGKGTVTESAPVAWQDVGGRRVPVAVAFRQLGEREVGFAVGGYDRARPLVIDPVLEWHTFVGGAGNNEALVSVVLDASGNIYAAGSANATYGMPVGAYSMLDDAWVVKLDATGSEEWHTFLGGSGTDLAFGVAVDGSGNVFVAGHSNVAWGMAPIRAFTTNLGAFDGFVAKLDGNGNLLWHTFLGGLGFDEILGVDLDPSGNVYVGGESGASWGGPILAYTNGGPGNGDTFVAKLNTSGMLQWHTFLGDVGNDLVRGIAVDGSGNAHVVGRSSATWGMPVRAFTASLRDGYVAKVDTSGTLLWNTFLGDAGADDANGVAVDGGGNVYVGGVSSSTWGTPVEAYTSVDDAFVAKLSASGALLWNSFVGGAGQDEGRGVAVDAGGNVYMSGVSSASWGVPSRDHTDSSDVFVVKLDGSGNFVWNTFLGGTGLDGGYGVALDADPEPNVYAVGFSTASWGTPLDGLSTGTDGFVAKLGPSRVLGATILGPGTGSISSSPPGIACLSDCEEEYALGTVVTLTATADPGSVFAGWLGDPDCADGAVTVDDDLTCAATFEFAPTPTPPPTAAKVVALSAWVDAGGRAVIAWETASEVDVLGFRVERSGAAGGPFAAVSPPIPARGDAAAGARYRWLDAPGPGTSYYRLVVVNAGGASEVFGPVVARALAWRAYLPALRGR